MANGSQERCRQELSSNPNRTNPDIARLLGVHCDTVRKVRNSMGIPSYNASRDDNSSLARCEKAIRDNPTLSNSEIAELAGCHYDTARKTRKSIGVPNPEPAKEPVVPVSGNIVHNDDYYYDQHADVYIVSLSKSPRPLVIKGETMRSMRRDYSEIDGTRLNVNEICVKYGIPFTWFMEFKKKLHWTHRDITFTDEEVRQKDVGALVDEALENKKRAFITSYQQRHLDEIKADAKKWRDFQFGKLNPWNEAFATPIDYKPSLIKPPKPFAKRFDMLVVVADDHFGYGKDSRKVMSGRPYDLAIAMNRMSEFGRVITDDYQSMGFGIDNAYILSMGDTYDADTREKTAAGTDRPQMNTPEETWLAATRAHADLTLAIKNIAHSVQRYNVAGNHSPFMDYALETYLQALMSKVDGIHVSPNDKPAVSFRIGSTQIVGHHGKGLAPTGSNFNADKQSKGSTIVTSWFKDDFAACRQHELFLAHVHHRVHAEMSQYNLHVVSSLMGPDAYSDSLILQSKPGAAYYLVGDDGIMFERFVAL